MFKIDQLKINIINKVINNITHLIANSVVIILCAHMNVIGFGSDQQLASMSSTRTVTLLNSFGYN